MPVASATTSRSYLDFHRAAQRRRRGAAAHPHPRSGRCHLSLRLYDRAGEDAFRETDRRQRHRPEAGGDGALRPRYRGPGRLHSTGAGRAAYPHPRRGQEDGGTDGARAARQVGYTRFVRRGRCSRDGHLVRLDQDVLSALVNLGCTRANAEAAVRKAKAKGPSTASSSSSAGRLS